MPLFKVLDNLTTQKKAVMANTISKNSLRKVIFMYFFVNYYFDGFSPRPYLLLFPPKNVSTVGVYWKTRARTHGQPDTDTRTLMEKTDSYGKDVHLWKRRTLMEKTDTKHLKPIF